MIAFPSVLNLELGSLFGGVLSVSASRSQLFLPRKFIFCRPNVKYGSWASASFKSKVVPPTLVTAAAEGEAKVVLHEFLREQGYSSAIATRTIKKSDPFVDHLVLRLYSLKKSGCPVGHEFTATEIKDALIPYLDSLLEDYGSNLVDFLENFPNLPAKGGDPVASTSSANLISSTKLNALSRVTETGPDGQLAPYVVYLLDFGMDVEQIKRIIYRYPKFAQLSLDGKIRPMIVFLLSLGLSNSDVSSIFIKFPRLCALSLSEKVIPTVKFLEKLGLNKRQVGRIMYRYPIVVAISMQKLESAVNFLCRMGLSAKDVGKIINRFPQITGCSLENNLQPKVEYFRSLGVEVDFMLLRWPKTLSISIEGNLKPTTEFFLARGYSKEEIATMVTRLGALYTCSLSKNLTPKWEFFLTMNYSKEDLIKFPQYFSYSLEGRIKPRYDSVKSAGVAFSLANMLTSSDDKFDKALANKIKKLRRR